MAQTILTRLFTNFFQSEKSGGIILAGCTAASLILTNAGVVDYVAFWNTPIGHHSLVHWINDGLMTIFFLLIGLELEREIYIGELSNLKNAMFPVFAALGNGYCLCTRGLVDARQACARFPQNFLNGAGGH